MGRGPAKSLAGGGESGRPVDIGTVSAQPGRYVVDLKQVRETDCGPFAGPWLVRTWGASSPKATSRTQCSSFGANLALEAFSRIRTLPVAPGSPRRPGARHGLEPRTAAPRGALSPPPARITSTSAHQAQHGRPMKDRCPGGAGHSGLRRGGGSATPTRKIPPGYPMVAIDIGRGRSAGLK